MVLLQLSSSAGRILRRCHRILAVGECRLFSSNQPSYHGAKHSMKVRPQGKLVLDLAGDPAGSDGVVLSTENENCDMVEFSLIMENKEGGENSEKHLEEPFEMESDGIGGVRLRARLSAGQKLVGLIPEKFSVDARTSGAGFSMARIEGGVNVDTGLVFTFSILLILELMIFKYRSWTTVMVTPDGGNITLDKVSEGPCQLKSGGGKINARVINGDAHIRTQGGEFVSKRMTGMRYDVDAEEGVADVRALYATQIRVAAKSIQCGSVHGSTSFTSAGGDVVIESGFDGHLEVQTNGGKCDMQLGSSSERIFVNSGGGDIHCRMPQDLEAKVEARGERGVLIDEALKDCIGYADVTCQIASGRVMAKSQTSGARGYTPTKATIMLDAGRGFVELRGKDWLSSLGSKFQKLKDLDK
eukprot:jgi/Bigna1/137135/aug1.37_g11843